MINEAELLRRLAKLFYYSDHYKGYCFGYIEDTPLKALDPELGEAFAKYVQENKIEYV